MLGEDKLTYKCRHNFDEGDFYLDVTKCCDLRSPSAAMNDVKILDLWARGRIKCSSHR